MKLLMENWREYLDSIETGEIFEHHEYITSILGIQLPLNESGEVQLNEELKAQILQEHLLYEGFLDSLVSGAKASAGKVKDLLMALAQILKDGNALKTFVHLLASKVIKPLANQFRKAFKKLKEAGGKVAGFIEKVSQMFEALLQKYSGMAIGWKKAMVGSTIALLLKFAYEKVKGMIGDVISGKIQDEFVSWLQEKFVSMFGEELFDKAMGHLTDVKKYLGWIGPIVGGINFVADTLVPITSRMKVISV